MCGIELAPACRGHFDALEGHGQCLSTRASTFRNPLPQSYRGGHRLDRVAGAQVLLMRSRELEVRQQCHAIFGQAVSGLIVLRRELGQEAIDAVLGLRVRVSAYMISRRSRLALGCKRLAAIHGLPPKPLTVYVNGVTPDLSITLVPQALNCLKTE